MLFLFCFGLVFFLRSFHFSHILFLGFASCWCSRYRCSPGTVSLLMTKTHTHTHTHTRTRTTFILLLIYSRWHSAAWPLILHSKPHIPVTTVCPWQTDFHFSLEKKYKEILKSKTLGWVLRETAHTLIMLGQTLSLMIKSRIKSWSQQVFLDFNTRPVDGIINSAVISCFLCAIWSAHWQIKEVNW